MEIFFQDPDEERLPPEKVRIQKLHAETWPDGQRVHIYLEVDPFQRRPSLELNILDPSGQEIASTSIIETMSRKLELTMHLRGEPAGGAYLLVARLFYTQLIEQGQTEPAPSPPIQVVDTSESSFSIDLPTTSSDS